MVDCSHANSSKQHERQVEVARDIAAQLAGGSRCIFGVMVESHLQAGAQKFTAGKDDPAQLEYGKSITDACLGWDDSLAVLEMLSAAVTRAALQRRTGRRRRSCGARRHCSLRSSTSRTLAPAARCASRRRRRRAIEVGAVEHARQHEQQVATGD